MPADHETKFWPVEIRLKTAEKRLEIDFDDGRTFRYPAEFLRVESPSAEVQGHGPSQKQLVHGRAHVGILGLEPDRGRQARPRLVASPAHLQKRAAEPPQSGRTPHAILFLHEMGNFLVGPRNRPEQVEAPPERLRLGSVPVQIAQRISQLHANRRGAIAIGLREGR